MNYSSTQLHQQNTKHSNQFQQRNKIKIQNKYKSVCSNTKEKLIEQYGTQTNNRVVIEQCEQND